MRRIIAGATGLVGKRLVEHWLQQNHIITVIGRSEQHIQEIFGTRVQAISWDRLTREHLQSAEVVVNLAGANIGEKRWTDARKRVLGNSRIDTTKKLAKMLGELGANAPPLFNASAVGVYGLQDQVSGGLPPRFEEISALAKPEDFLSMIGQQWESAASPAIEHGVRVVFMRFGVVLAKEGGALPKMVMPFRFFVGGTIGAGDQPFSWVAIDDLLRAIDFLLATPNVSGPYNIVSPKCVTQRQLAQAIAHVLHRPAVVPMPAFAVKLLFGEMGRELLLEGQHVYPLRLLDMGFKFEYADIESALKHLISDSR